MDQEININQEVQRYKVEMVTIMKKIETLKQQFFETLEAQKRLMLNKEEDRDSVPDQSPHVRNNQSQPQSLPLEAQVRRGSQEIMSDKVAQPTKLGEEHKTLTQDSQQLQPLQADPDSKIPKRFTEFSPVGHKSVGMIAHTPPFNVRQAKANTFSFASNAEIMQRLKVISMEMQYQKQLLNQVKQKRRLLLQAYIGSSHPLTSQDQSDLNRPLMNKGSWGSLQSKKQQLEEIKSDPQPTHATQSILEVDEMNGASPADMKEGVTSSRKSRVKSQSNSSRRTQKGQQLDRISRKSSREQMAREPPALEPENPYQVAPEAKKRLSSFSSMIKITKEKHDLRIQCSLPQISQQRSILKQATGERSQRALYQKRKSAASIGLHLSELPPSLRGNSQQSSRSSRKQKEEVKAPNLRKSILTKNPTTKKSDQERLEKLQTTVENHSIIAAFGQGPAKKGAEVREESPLKQMKTQKVHELQFRSLNHKGTFQTQASPHHRAPTQIAPSITEEAKEEEENTRQIDKALKNQEPRQSIASPAGPPDSLHDEEEIIKFEYNRLIEEALDLMQSEEPSSEKLSNLKKSVEQIKETAQLVSSQNSQLKKSLDEARLFEQALDEALQLIQSGVKSPVVDELQGKYKQLEGSRKKIEESGKKVSDEIQDKYNYLEQCLQAIEAKALQAEDEEQRLRNYNELESQLLTISHMPPDTAEVQKQQAKELEDALHLIDNLAREPSGDQIGPKKKHSSAYLAVEQNQSSQSKRVSSTLHQNSNKEEDVTMEYNESLGSQQDITKKQKQFMKSQHNQFIGIEHLEDKPLELARSADQEVPKPDEQDAKTSSGEQFVKSVLSSNKKSIDFSQHAYLKSIASNQHHRKHQAQDGLSPPISQATIRYGESGANPGLPSNEENEQNSGGFMLESPNLHTQTQKIMNSKPLGKAATGSVYRHSVYSQSRAAAANQQKSLRYDGYDSNKNSSAGSVTSLLVGHEEGGDKQQKQKPINLNNKLTKEVSTDKKPREESHFDEHKPDRHHSSNVIQTPQLQYQNQPPENKSAVPPQGRGIRNFAKENQSTPSDQNQTSKSKSRHASQVSPIKENEDEEGIEDFIEATGQKIKIVDPKPLPPASAPPKPAPKGDKEEAKKKELPEETKPAELQKPEAEAEAVATVPSEKTEEQPKKPLAEQPEPPLQETKLEIKPEKIVVEPKEAEEKPVEEPQDQTKQPEQSEPSQALEETKEPLTEDCASFADKAEPEQPTPGAEAGDEGKAKKPAEISIPEEEGKGEHKEPEKTSSPKVQSKEDNSVLSKKQIREREKRRDSSTLSPELMARIQQKQSNQPVGPKPPSSQFNKLKDIPMPSSFHSSFRGQTSKMDLDSINNTPTNKASQKNDQSHSSLHIAQLTQGSGIEPKSSLRKQISHFVKEKDQMEDQVSDLENTQVVSPARSEAHPGDQQDNTYFSNSGHMPTESKEDISTGQIASGAFSNSGGKPEDGFKVKTKIDRMATSKADTLSKPTSNQYSKKLSTVHRTEKKSILIVEPLPEQPFRPEVVPEEEDYVSNQDQASFQRQPSIAQRDDLSTTPAAGIKVPEDDKKQLANPIQKRESIMSAQALKKGPGLEKNDGPLFTLKEAAASIQPGEESQFSQKQETLYDAQISQIDPSAVSRKGTIVSPQVQSRAAEEFRPPPMKQPTQASLKATQRRPSTRGSGKASGKASAKGSARGSVRGSEKGSGQEQAPSAKSSVKGAVEKQPSISQVAQASSRKQKTTVQDQPLTKLQTKLTKLSTAKDGAFSKAQARSRETEDVYGVSVGVGSNPVHGRNISAGVGSLGIASESRHSIGIGSGRVKSKSGISIGVGSAAVISKGGISIGAGSNPVHGRNTSIGVGSIGIASQSKQSVGIGSGEAKAKSGISVGVGSVDVSNGGISVGVGSGIITVAAGTASGDPSSTTKPPRQGHGKTRVSTAKPAPNESKKLSEINKTEAGYSEMQGGEQIIDVSESSRPSDANRVIGKQSEVKLSDGKGTDQKTDVITQDLKITTEAKKAPEPLTNIPNNYNISQDDTVKTPNLQPERGVPNDFRRSDTTMRSNVKTNEIKDAEQVPFLVTPSSKTGAPQTQHTMLSQMKVQISEEERKRVENGKLTEVAEESTPKIPPESIGTQTQTNFFKPPALTEDREMQTEAEPEPPKIEMATHSVQAEEERSPSPEPIEMVSEDIQVSIKEEKPAVVDRSMQFELETSEIGLQKQVSSTEMEMQTDPLPRPPTPEPVLPPKPEISEIGIQTQPEPAPRPPPVQTPPVQQQIPSMQQPPLETPQKRNSLRNSATRQQQTVSSPRGTERERGLQPSRGQDEQGNFFRQYETRNQDAQTSFEVRNRQAFTSTNRVVDMKVTLKQELPPPIETTTAVSHELVQTSLNLINFKNTQSTNRGVQTTVTEPQKTGYDTIDPTIRQSPKVLEIKSTDIQKYHNTHHQFQTMDQRRSLREEIPKDEEPYSQKGDEDGPNHGDVRLKKVTNHKVSNLKMQILDIDQAAFPQSPKKKGGKHNNMAVQMRKQIDNSARNQTRKEMLLFSSSLSPRTHHIPASKKNRPPSGKQRTKAMQQQLQQQEISEWQNQMSNNTDQTFYHQMASQSQTQFAKQTISQRMEDSEYRTNIQLDIGPGIPKQKLRQTQKDTTQLLLRKESTLKRDLKHRYKELKKSKKGQNEYTSETRSKSRDMDNGSHLNLEHPIISEMMRDEEVVRTSPRQRTTKDKKKRQAVSQQISPHRFGAAGRGDPHMKMVQEMDHYQLVLKKNKQHVRNIYSQLNFPTIQRQNISTSHRRFNNKSALKLISQEPYLPQLITYRLDDQFLESQKRMRYLSQQP